MTKVLKKDQKQFVRTQLSVNEKWAKHALVKIFDCQTEDEQDSGCTNEFNNVGFSGSDSEILTSFAKQLINKGWLSPKQMKIVYKKMPKYSRQIIEMSDVNVLNKMVLKNLN